MHHHPHETPYYSLYPAEAHWGAAGTSFQSPWEGVNLLCPPPTDTLISKTIRWAIGSALLTTTPTLHLLYLPTRAGPHLAWTRHPLIHKIADVQNGTQWTPSYGWNGLPPTPCTPRGHGTLYVVANKAGAEQYLTAPQWKILKTQLNNALYQSDTRRPP